MRFGSGTKRRSVKNKPIFQGEFGLYLRHDILLGVDCGYTCITAVANRVNSRALRDVGIAHERVFEGLARVF
jgi:hypothetical protein